MNIKTSPFMKSLKILPAIAAMIVTCAALNAADYTDGNLRKNDNKWVNLNLYAMYHTANAFGGTYDNTYLEVEGGARSGVLDLYYFFDINEIFGLGTSDNDPGNFFTKVKPRFSIDAITKKDLSIGPIKEWFFATQYKGFNGGEYYYAGVGTDVAIPGVELFQVNLWPQYLRFTNDSTFHYAGLQISMNWYKTLCKLPWDATLTYQGWLDYGFLNDYNVRAGGNTTRDELQMFNGFFFNKNNYSLSLDVKFHRHFTYYDQEHSNAVTYFFGAHYKI